jgi:polysaccharide deacetylase family protein (PEP-CTERM system associated)
MGVSGSTTEPDREIRHHLSVDVEEYYQVSALEPHLPRERWPEIESRLQEGMARLLDLLDEFDTRSTFFVLGCVAEKHPGLIRDLAQAGHEIASHGWDHQRVGRLSPEEFRTQVRDTRALLEDLSGTRVDGYRAPSFSITRGAEWALEIIQEEGYGYDSSLYPVRRPGYGYAGGERGITTLELEGGNLVEVPPATLRVAGANLPVGGGGSLRHLPLGLVRAALTRYGRNGGGATLYLHPWELDPDQPRVDGTSWLTRLRHYGGLRKTEPRLRRLLSEFRFQTIRQTLGEKGYL